MAKRLIAAGGGIVVRQKALKISQSYGGIELRTEQERIRAQSVVIATNGYSEELFPFFGAGLFQSDRHRRNRSAIKRGL